MVADAAAQDRILLAAGGIYRTTNPKDNTYGEGLARVGDENGILIETVDLISYLDRLRLTPALDRRIPALVRDSLESEPDLCLGCNISGQNLVNRPAWRALFDQIAARPQLAVRLAATMQDEARSLGSRIAMDFGVRLSSLRLIQQINFEIINIDRSFVHAAERSATGGDYFADIVSFASNYAPLVVVEEVETVSDLERARAGGTTHVQGHYFVPLFDTVRD
ncbi:EAL domain-containing protein [Brucella ciceri]|uniref:EAL domain-containing protein n=1 Tax=Brucella ciceri TaxID=391287 RepID=UPI0035BBE086